MTEQEAKEILRFYRPGTADSEDQDFERALQLCEERPELKAWFEDHCAVYMALRSRMKQVPVPEGLAQQIIAEREIQTTRRPSARPVRAVVAVMAIIVTIAAAVFLRVPAEDIGFVGFRERMISTALRSYGMDLQSENLDRIRTFLLENGAIADYRLPDGLRDAKPIGCVATTWQGQPVSMICFRSSKPLVAGRISDVWLFVTDPKSVPGAPRRVAPEFFTFNNTTAAAWTEGGRTYLLAVEGDRGFLERFL